MSPWNIEIVFVSESRCELAWAFCFNFSTNRIFTWHLKREWLDIALFCYPMKWNISGLLAIQCLICARITTLMPWQYGLNHTLTINMASFPLSLKVSLSQTYAFAVLIILHLVFHRLCKYLWKFVLLPKCSLAECLGGFFFFHT